MSLLLLDIWTFFAWNVLKFKRIYLQKKVSLVLVFHCKERKF